MSKSSGVSESRTKFVHDEDTPELTAERAARLRPAREVLPPEIIAQFKRSPGRPNSPAPKRQVTLRLDPEVIERWRAKGPGWQTEINATLRKAVGL